MAMSDDHKAALARGRAEARAIKRYLEALGNRRPGRPVTASSLKDRIAKLEQQIEEETDALRRVELVQKRIDNEASLKTLGDGADMAELERDFVAHAKAYSERKGIGYQAWREAGVSAAALKAAGIPQTRRR